MARTERELDGKVAIVTGAGIVGAVGAVCAQALAEAGAKLVLTDLRPEGLEEVRSVLAAHGADVAVMAGDLQSEDSIKSLVQLAVDRFGGLDIIENNAAATHLVPHDLDLSTLTPELFDATMAINLRAPALLCRHGIPEMLRRGGGAIVNISSGKSLMGDLDGPAYAMSKAGLNMLTLSVATMYGARGIRCNTVVNGVIRTPLMKSMLPDELQAAIAADCLVPRLGEPEDVANAVVFLASDRAAYINGHTLPVDGGALVHVPFYRWRREAMADETVMKFVD